MVSIIIVNWNSREYIDACLQSVFRQTYTPLEVITVDNGSTDGSLEIIRDKFSQVKIIANKTNVGFAPAQNQGMAVAQGEWVMPLNFDVILDQDYVRKIIESFSTDASIGGISGKILKAGRTEKIIDAGGFLIFTNRTTRDRGINLPDLGQFEEKEFCFWINGCTPIYRKKMLEEIKFEDEYFDPDFFAYYEDVDLCWRANTRGWKFQYLPTALAYHYRSVTEKKIKKTIRIHGFKNRYLMILKNDSWENIWPDLPAILLYELELFSKVIFEKPYLLKGYFDALRLMPRMLRKRNTSKANIRNWLRTPENNRALGRRLLVRVGGLIIIFLLIYIRFCP